MTSQLMVAVLSLSVLKQLHGKVSVLRAWTPLALLTYSYFLA